MNITFSSDNLHSSVTVALRGWRSYIVGICLLILLGLGVYTMAIRLAESWIQDQDPRIIKLVKAELARVNDEKDEFLKRSVERLNDNATETKVRLWELTELSNLIAERLGLPIELQVKQSNLPGEDESIEQSSELSLEKIEQQHVELSRQFDRLTSVFDQYTSISAHQAMLISTIPSLESPIANGRRVSGFGYRNDPFTGKKAFHSGYDFAARKGTPIRATTNGIVTRTGRLGNYGITAEIYHGSNISTLYAHMSKVHVKTGKYVQLGELIGEVGSTGRSTGAHLHYEIRVSNKPHSFSAFKKQFKDRFALLELVTTE